MGWPVSAVCGGAKSSFSSSFFSAVLLLLSAIDDGMCFWSERKITSHCVADLRKADNASYQINFCRRVEGCGKRQWPFAVTEESGSFLQPFYRYLLVAL